MLYRVILSEWHNTETQHYLEYVSLIKNVINVNISKKTCSKDKITGPDASIFSNSRWFVSPSVIMSPSFPNSKIVHSPFAMWFPRVNWCIDRERNQESGIWTFCLIIFERECFVCLIYCVHSEDKTLKSLSWALQMFANFVKSAKAECVPVSPDPSAC